MTAVKAEEAFMKISLRRFDRGRRLSVWVEVFHTSVFPVEIKNFQVTKGKPVTIKPLRRALASHNANGNSADNICAIVQHREF